MLAMMSRGPTTFGRMMDADDAQRGAERSMAWTYSEFLSDSVAVRVSRA